MDNNKCPVCGYPELSLGVLDAGGLPSFDTCPSCGFEFGFTDDVSHEAYHSYRKKWVEGGLCWWSSSREPPHDWNPLAQLKGVTQESGEGA